MPRLTTFLLPVALATLIVAGSGCGSDDTTASTSSTDEAPASSVSEDLAEKPVVEAPEGEPPTELESIDIVEGDGATAEAGSIVTVQYVGVDYETGEEFDASWGGEPFQFQLGSGSVIPGWDQGVEGMKVGGRRELIIPPDLAYGKQGSPPIGPDATLVFVIDMLDVK